MGLKSRFIFNDKLKNQCFYQKISGVDQLIDVVCQVALHSALLFAILFTHNNFLMKRTPLVLAFILSVLLSSKIKAQVFINEIQTSNTKTIADEFYSWDDWIEIYNAGSTIINLNGYGLSDDSLKPFRFTFPDYNLSAGSRILVFASDTNKTVLTHWETAVKASDSWKYRANTTNPGTANWRDPIFNDASWASGVGGIGMGDSDDGTTISGCVSVYMRRSFTIADTSKLFEAVFNMDYDDGFVAYLNGVEIARINCGTPGNIPAWNAIALASHEAVLYQNQYPDSTHLNLADLRKLLVNGTNVLAVETHNESGSFFDLSSNPFLTFAVANGSTFFPTPPTWFHSAPSSYFHAKFKISKTGETIFLTSPSGVLTDKKATGNIEVDNSIARNPDGSSNWCLCDKPTPGTTNNINPCKSGYASIPIFSLASGFYSGTKNLVLSTIFPSGEIRFTTDGSNVSDTSSLYTTPIVISSSKTIRARVFANGIVGSATVTNSYFINLDCKLPVFSLTTDPKNLYDYNYGIFVDGPNAATAMPHFGANYWLDMEKDVTLEFYERDKSLQFKFNAGLSITGGWSRTAPQKSLEIKLGDKYGLSSLNYSLETLKPWNDKWDDFILHNTGNDRNLCHMRDPLMNRILKPTFNNYLAYEPCMVMLNGQNWGIYYTRENDDNHWVQLNYGYKSSEIDFLKESYFFPGMEIKKGSDSAFFAMYNYATQTSPTDTAYYSRISSMMDLQNMADYFIAETYYPNDDWMGGGNNNLKLWRPRTQDGKFKYLIYDLDFGLGLNGTVTNNMLRTALNPSPHNYNADLFRNFTQNPTYKRYFINRYADLINTIFLPSNIQKEAYLLRDSIKFDYHFQYQKWGAPDSTTWINDIASMMTFVNARPANARNFVQSEFGMTGQVTLTLQVSPAGAGTIQISTINPKTYPWNGVYYNGNPVTITAIPNPGFTFNHWNSAIVGANNLNSSVTYNFTTNDLITCYFTGAVAPVTISFSELNYHSDTISDSGDWIELHNSGSYSIDLSNWIFRDEADNHNFVFPVSTIVPAFGYLVLASNLSKFKSVNPTVNNVIGDFSFDFSNIGEELRLFNSSDQLYTSFIYSDQLPFPIQADGFGYTLERLNESVSANDGNNWFLGCLRGSPGRAYTPPMAIVTTPSSAIICAGNSSTISVTPVANAVYQWIKNNSIINGAVNQTLDVNSTGYYKVQVTANGCSATSDSIQLTVQAIEQILSSVDSSRCGDGVVSLVANGTSSLNWFQDSAATTVLFNGNNFVTPILNQTTNYFVQADGYCPSQRKKVTAIINTITPDPIVTDVERCGVGSITFSVTDSSTINWYDSPTVGAVLYSGNNFTTTSISTTTNYFVSAGTICPSSRVMVTGIIHEINADPIVTSAGRCGDGQVTLIAQDTANVYWYDFPANGNLIFTGTNFETPVLTSSVTYYVQAGTLCPSAIIPVTASIENISPPPIVSDVSRCGNGIVNLISNTSTTAWFIDTTSTNPIFVGSTFTSPLLNSSIIYFVQDGFICPSPRLSVQVNIIPPTPNPVATDVERCGSGMVALEANSSVTINWFNVANGIPIYSGLQFTTPVISNSTTYYVQATDGICPSDFVPIIATIHDVPNDAQVVSGTICGSGSMTLLASSSDSIAWYDFQGGNLLATGNSYSTSVLNSSQIYYVQTSNEFCSGNYVAVEANVNPNSIISSVNNGGVCESGSVLLSANSTSSIEWFDAIGGNLLATGNNFSTPIINSTTIYYAIAAGLCPSLPIAVTANIYPLPVVFLGNDTTITSGQVLVLDAGNGFVNYNWNTMEVSQMIIANVAGNYSVLITDVNGCSASDTIVVSLIDQVIESHSKFVVNVYPNPTIDKCIIDLGEINSNYIVKLFDSHSKLLVTKEVNHLFSKTELDLSAYANGNYFISISTEKESFIQKIVKQ